MAKKRQSKVRPRERSGNRRSARARRPARRSLVLEKRNYVLMAVGVAMITLGYVVMRMDNQVESFVSLYLAPLIILAGYIEIGYAILWKPRTPDGEEAG